MRRHAVRTLRHAFDCGTGGAARLRCTDEIVSGADPDGRARTALSTPVCAGRHWAGSPYDASGRLRAAFAFAMLVMSGPEAMAAGVSILGKWQIVEAVPAPWSRPEEQAALAAGGKRFLNTEVLLRRVR